MSDVETLRRAASLMRERAEKATPGPWQATVYGVRTPTRAPVAPFDGDQPDMDNRLHIASWHPAVALAVAGVLDKAIRAHETCMNFNDDLGDIYEKLLAESDALTIARVYLGES